ncbi:MAG: hypothetical protein JNM07_02405 [Phycisphaerae bacterium]|nr:hypothetical protein [Phycisphaerae bacterium]
MSAKWERSKRWDDQHIPRWLWPVRLLLRVFSSIPLAVFLLTCVAVYGTLASVPIGMLAKIPTALLVAATACLTVGTLGAVPTWVMGRVLRARGAGRGTRFAACLLAMVALGVGSLWLWGRYVWPALRFDPTTGRGFMLFSDFVERYKSTTLRRLPGMEMTELEFYSWWPLKVVLLAFVMNMVIATLRRIEFKFVNIGVLTVHAGIVIIALGSVYYQRLKEEGNVLLLAGEPDPATGAPTPGRPELGFYDNTRVCLWINQGRRWEQRLLVGVPRYNDYALDAVEASMLGGASSEPDGRRLSIDVPAPSPGLTRPGTGGGGESDVSYEIVGYASYAELVPQWLPDERAAPDPTSGRQPMRLIELLSSVGTDGSSSVSPQPAGRFALVPGVPAQRIGTVGGILSVEYARGTSDARWAELGAELPAGAGRGLVVEVPGRGFRGVFEASEGARIEVGDTGWTLDVRELHARPPFPIITPGYRDAESGVAVVRVIPPDVPGASSPADESREPFTRWVYERFPEISQDLIGEAGASGMPKRRAPDSRIRLAYIDATSPRVYFDERSGAGGGGERVRAMVRVPGRPAVVSESVGEGESVSVGPMVSLRLGRRWSHAREVELPDVVPELRRDKQEIGTHARAALAVRVRAGAFETVVWVPFSQFLGVSPERERRVVCPDGRELRLVFGRLWRPFPGFALQLADFEMTPYPHSETPRDFRSEVLVIDATTGQPWAPSGQESSAGRRSTSLNDPLLLRVPFDWSKERPTVANAVGRALSVVAPNQYKFSQAGWDQQGWSRTREAAERGELPRAYATFTILGVGNNPGIYLIAAGAVMMSVGIPWAFYIKPLILRAQKRRIQAQLAAATPPRAAAGADDTRADGKGAARSVPRGAKNEVSAGA